MSFFDELDIEEFIDSCEIYDVEFVYRDYGELGISGWFINYNMGMCSFPVDLDEVFKVVKGCNESTTDKEFLEKFGCQDSDERLVLCQKLRKKVMTDPVVDHIDEFQKLFKMIDIDLEYNGNYLSFYFSDGRHLNVNVSSFEQGLIYGLGYIFLGNKFLVSPYDALKQCRRL